MTTPETSYTRYPPTERSAASARATVRAFCAAHAMTHLLDDATLVASELVTNACRAAAADVTLALVADHETLLMIVGDDCADSLPPTGDGEDAMAESGRGLFVLDQLAGAWGCTATRMGKNVWCRLP